jgi:hypothetical protein
MRKMIGHGLKVLVPLFLGGCASVPEGLEPVGDFEVSRYLARGTKSPDWTIHSSAD